MTTFDNACDFDAPASSQDKLVPKAEIDQLEQAAIERIRGWQRLDGIENVAVGVSFGLDSIPLANIAVKAGITDSCVVWTPTGYPQHKVFARNMADRIGLDLTELNIDWWTNEWVAHNRKYLFPNAREVDTLTGMRQLGFIEDYIEDNDINMFLYGRRHGDNPANATQPLRKRANLTPDPCYAAHPIAEWKLEHVLSYMEYHDFRPSPIYRMRNANSNGNGDGPWHDRDHIDRDGNVIQPLDSCWYTVYDLAAETGGHPAFWHDILRWFPQGHDLARTYAQRNDLPYDHDPPHPDDYHVPKH